MELVFLVMSIQFAAGAAGTFLIGRKLSEADRKKDWLKYFSYLLIFIVVTTAAIAGREFMLGISILIYSAGLLEIMIVSKGACNFASRDKTIATAVCIYLLLALLFSLFLFLPMNLIIYTYILVVIFDGACQIAGKYAGKHKITPVISPSKTIEGTVGGSLSTLLTGLILHNFANLTLVRAFFIVLVICFSAFAGDIAASFFKRAFNRKDFSDILPGQGGVLDRFDSFIFSGSIMGLVGYLFVSMPEIDWNLAAYLAYSIGFVIILFAAEVFQYLFGLKSEYSRIIIHVAIGFACIFMTRLFTSGIYIILFCLQSAVFTHVSGKLKVFDGLNAVARKSNGGAYFFIGVMIAYAISRVFHENSFFILPVLVMTFCDPAASLTGMNVRTGAHNRFGKTIIGSAAFFVSSFSILFAWFILYSKMNYPAAMIIAFSLSVVSTFAEYFSGWGLDNITVPAAISACMVFSPGIL